MSTTPETPAGDLPQDDGAQADRVQDDGAQADVTEVRSVVDPATVRRAPRYRAFFWIGAIVGIALGLWLGLYLLATFDPARDRVLYKPGVYVSVLVLGTTTVTTLLAGLVAILLDRRSLRRQAGTRDV